jgi:endoglucanase
MRHIVKTVVTVLLLAAPLAEAQSYKGVNLAGAAFAPTVLPGIYGQNYIFPTPAEISYFTGEGMNIFRLSIAWERLQPRLAGPLDPDELQRLIAFITAANRRHAAVIIDIHNYGAYRGIPVGQSPVSNAAFADLWRRVALNFGGNDGVIFGLMNEPQIAQIGTWKDAVQKAIDAIRRTGAGNRILVSGTQWDGAAGFPAISGASLLTLQDPDRRLIFEVHQYFDTDSSGTAPGCISAAQAIGRLVPFTQWLRVNRQHGFLGEFGVSPQPQCLRVLNQVLAYLKTNADLWSGWTYWAAGPVWGDYMFSIEPGPITQHPQMRVLEKYLAANTPGD